MDQEIQCVAWAADQAEDGQHRLLVVVAAAAAAAVGVEVTVIVVTAGAKSVRGPPPKFLLLPKTWRMFLPGERYYRTAVCRRRSPLSLDTLHQIFQP